MMKNFLIVTIVLFFTLNCQQKSGNLIKSDSSQKKEILNKSKTETKNDYNCLISLENREICDLGINNLDGKIQNIKIIKFAFEATPYVYNHRVVVNRATPVSFYISDFENISNFLDVRTTQYLKNPKGSYVLMQGNHKFYVKSFKILNLKPNVHYRFSAICYSVTTAIAKGYNTLEKLDHYLS